MPTNVQRFLRRCSPDSIRSLMRSESIILSDDLDWTRGPRKYADAVIIDLSLQRPEIRPRIYAVMQNLERMANDQGVRCLIEEATRHAGFKGDDAGFQVLTSNQDRAIYFWIRYHHVWNVSKRLAATEELSNSRFWHERPNAPVKPPAHDDAACAALGATLSTVFSAQLRGQKYRIEPHLREDGSCFYYAILKDLPTTEEVFSASGDELVSTVRERVFEVIIHCPAMGGSLACHIEGGADRALRESVFSAFSLAIFQESLPQLIPRHPTEDRWKLDHLLTQRILAADSASGATHGRVLAVTVVALGRGNEKTTFEADPSKDPTSMADHIRQWIDPERIPLSSLRVRYAKLQLEWPSRGRRRRVLTWEVSLPGGCTLKSQREDRRLIGEHHMLLWRIDVSGSTQRALPPGTAA